MLNAPTRQHIIRIQPRYNAAVASRMPVSNSYAIKRTPRGDVKFREILLLAWKFRGNFRWNLRRKFHGLSMKSKEKQTPTLSSKLFLYVIWLLRRSWNNSEKFQWEFKKTAVYNYNVIYFLSLSPDQANVTRPIYKEAVTSLISSYLISSEPNLTEQQHLLLKISLLRSGRSSVQFSSDKMTWVVWMLLEA